VTAPLPDLVIYGRPGCHLCEDAKTLLEALLADRAAYGLAAPPLVERNIEDDEDALRRYVLTIPVVTYGERELPLATSVSALRRFLADALDGATPA
jgi:glutaredoxin